MKKYPAIWRTETMVDSSALLSEFEDALRGRLQVVYPKNPNWTGITVLSPGKQSFLSELPNLSVFIGQFGVNGCAASWCVVNSILFVLLSRHGVFLRWRR